MHGKCVPLQDKIREEMRYAVIAAGEGSRLKEEGIDVPKPLVKVHGECLIDRLVRIFLANKATEIVVICNGITPLVSQHLDRLGKYGLDGKAVPLRYMVKTTPSSMHSFYEISPYLEPTPFVLTTVDTIFPEGEFAEYVKAFEAETKAGWDGLMGVTGFVDDEKPLYVDTDERLAVRGFHDDNALNCPFVSAGIYGLTPDALPILRNSVANGESRMRNFQRAMVANGLKLKAWPFSKVFDIDHASDVKKAEDFLK